MSEPTDSTAMLLVEEGIQTALQVARAGVWELDLNDSSSVYSDGYYDIMGLPADARRREPDFWRSRVHPDDIARVQAAFNDYAAHLSGVFEQEYRLRHDNGQWVWVFVRGRAVGPNADGSFRKVAGFLVDVSERRALMDTLRRSEERYRQAVSAIRGMIYEVDLSNDEAIQHGVERLLGHIPQPGADALAMWLSLVHPDDRDQLREVIRTHRLTGADYELTYRVQHVDGRILYVWHRGTYLHDAAGVPERAFGIVQDVTADRRLHEELRNTEIALRESKQVLSTVSESSPVHLTLFDRDLRCIFANRALDGSSPEHNLGRRIEEIVPDYKGVAARARFERVLADGQGQDFVDWFDLPGRGTRYFHVLLRPVMADGKVIGIVSNVSDITDARLQQDQRRLQAGIIERMREGVILLDNNANILFTNHALDAMFGYASGELAGRDVAKLGLQQPERLLALRELMLAGLETPQGNAVELEGRLRDGSQRAFQCLVSRAQIGERRCVIVVVSDVSEQRRLQRELLQLEARVQHQIGSDLHDGVGQQLAGIAMMLKSLVRRIGVGDSRELRADVQNIIDLVNQALQSTRSLARGLAPVRSDREGLFEGFEELAQQVHDRYRVRVSLQLDLPPEAPFDENCASNLYRIAQEGVLNAARHGRASHIQVSLRTDGRMADLEIRDDGRGFDPKNVGRGGMGLRVMRFRAQMLGGYLSVASTPGSGTTLHCRCPLQPEREVA